MSNPLRLRTHANGVYNNGVIVTSDAELDYVVKLINTNYATESGAGDYTGDLNINSAGASVGTFVDNFAQGELLSHPYANSAASTTYTFKQNTSTSTESSMIYPATHGGTVNPGHIKPQTSTELNNTIITLCLNDIAKANSTAAGVGTYYVGANAPSISGTWAAQDTFIDEVTNNTNDDDEKTSYKLWRKTSYDGSPAAVSLIKQTSVSLKEMTSAEVETLTARLRNRIISTGIGTYKFQATSPGTGTWVARGTATDRNPNITSVQYTGTYSAQYTGQFARQFTRQFSDQYVRGQYARAYITQYQRVYSQAYGRSFARGYSVQYSRGVVGTQYAGSQYARLTAGPNYARSTPGPQYAGTQYTRQFARVYTGQYGRAYNTQYQREFSRGTAYAVSFNAQYGRGVTYAVAYIAVYFGSYARSTPGPNYTTNYARTTPGPSYGVSYGRSTPGPAYTGTQYSRLTAGPNYSPQYVRQTAGFDFNRGLYYRQYTNVPIVHDANGGDAGAYHTQYNRGPLPGPSYTSTTLIYNRQFTADYTRATYTRVYSQGYNIDYARVYSAGYGRAFGRVYSANYARTRNGPAYARDYYARVFAGSRAYGAYARAFNGPQYTGAFFRAQYARSRPGPNYNGPQYNDQFARTYSQDYGRSYTAQYTRQFTRTFVGQYTSTFARNVSYTVNFTRSINGPLYAGTFSRGQFAGQYTRVTTGPQYSTNYSNLFAGSRDHQYTGATVSADYTENTKTLWLRIA